MSERIRLKKRIIEFSKTKQNKINYIGGLLGTYINGTQTIKVFNRPGFVYVRIGGNLAEVVEAENSAVAEIFDLKVLIRKSETSPNIYEVVSRDKSQYDKWSVGQPYLARHGNTHSFGDGNDPVWVYRKQLIQPIQARPTDTRSQYLYIQPDFYQFNNEIKYFVGGNTVDLTICRPTDGLHYRWLTVYLNNNNQLGYITGVLVETVTPFSNVPTGTVYFIPEVDPNIGIPLAAVYLTSGTTTIGWDDFVDIRPFLINGAMTPLQHELDPLYGYHTGTLRASVVTVNDVGNFYTGTVVEDVLQEINQQTFTGGLYKPIKTVYTNYTGTLSDYTILANAISGSLTITLLAPTGTYNWNTNVGHIYNIKKVDNTKNTIRVISVGSNLIDDKILKDIKVYNTTMKVQSNGSSWSIL